MIRQARADKILVLGVDGMDPRFTRKMVDEGYMPNVKKYIERGACREDLVMLGGHPTVTPPMWTTLATGCYANVHGITGYFRNGKEIGTSVYNVDSRLCKAEQVWNCFAEAGKKTLVWHWPGSSWPPSSDSENLYVVDGTAPGSVNMAIAQVDTEFLLIADVNTTEVVFREKTETEANAACVMTDLDLGEEEEIALGLASSMNFDKPTSNVIYKQEQMTSAITEIPLDKVFSPVKEASGWAEQPKDAKEFSILLSRGLIRRPALILKNESGIYDRVAIYKNKKETEPIAVCPLGEMVVGVLDEAIKGEEKYHLVNRNIKLLRLSEDGSGLTMFISAGQDCTNDSVWHPKRLFKEVIENVGYPTPTCMVGCQDPMLITECMLANWYTTADWQSKALLHLIEKEKLDVIFSHFHAIDLEAHMFIKHLADKPENRQPVEVAEKWMRDIYIQTDYYLGKFIHLLDEGWTILLLSDHGQVSSKHDVPMLNDNNGVVTPLMEEMGYTVLKRNKNGDRIGVIDWEKTRAVIQREGHLYLNIKGRDKHTLSDGTIIDGIVDPVDKYELEEEIMTKLYQLTDSKTGHRIVSVALRNKDAVLLGQGGPEAGDILLWNAEGYAFDHADCISTTLGECSTSVSPFFIAAGKGFKEGFYTDRIIREIDVAATLAILGGVRFPAQCEGAPVYQIFAEEV